MPSDKNGNPTRRISSRRANGRKIAKPIYRRGIASAALHIVSARSPKLSRLGHALMALVSVAVMTAPAAPAASGAPDRQTIPATGRERHHYSRYFGSKVSHVSYLWCVPFARKLSRIDLRGDAFLWWAKAEGRYARGHEPRLGSILTFRSTSRIPLGHLAVVVKIINRREILVSQANWVADEVTRNVPVIDVSPDNTWTAVRQSVGGNRFGMVYSTYGFIYDHQPRTFIADRAAGQEVAEAPQSVTIRSNGPNRNLR